MNILFINKEDEQGGAAGMASGLASELIRQGHQVRFIVRRKFTTNKNIYELRENIILFWLRKIFKKDFTIVLSSLRDQILANDVDFGVAKEIIDHPWVNWADIIHCHNLHGNYFKLKNLTVLSKKRPLVWTLHDLWAVTGHCATPHRSSGVIDGFFQCPRLGDYQKILWNNTKYLCSRKRGIYNDSDFTVVTPSNSMKEKISLSVLRRKDIVVIPNGIDTNLFKKYEDKNTQKTELNLPKNKKIIIFFTYGWQNHAKGWGHLKKIFPAYKRRNDVIFVGIGAPKKALDGNVLYVKPIRDPKILSQYYNCADLLLFPSLGESFGLVPLEASACGTPVVAFPVGIIPELISHKKNGYIAKYNNFSDLKNGVDYILGLTSAKLKGFTRLSLVRVRKNYSLDKVAQAYSKIYSSFDTRTTVSVIIATFNNDSSLQKTIDSFIGQKYQHKELIIIDGGSTDFTTGIIKKNSSKISYWISEKDKGISDAFNKGVKAAKGDYLLFLGAGDYLWSNNVLKKAMTDVNKRKDMFVCGRINRVTEDGEKVLYTTKINFKKWHLLYKMGLPHQGLFTNRKYFEKYGKFDLNCKYAMDYELLLRRYKDFPQVIMKDLIVSAWREGGIGKDKTIEILNEYRRIKIKNHVAPKWVVDTVDILSKLKYFLINISGDQR